MCKLQFASLRRVYSLRAVNHISWKQQDNVRKQYRCHFLEFPGQILLFSLLFTWQCEVAAGNDYREETGSAELALGRWLRQGLPRPAPSPQPRASPDTCTTQPRAARPPASPGQVLPRGLQKRGFSSQRHVLGPTGQLRAANPELTSPAMRVGRKGQSFPKWGIFHLLWCILTGQWMPHHHPGYSEVQQARRAWHREGLRPPPGPGPSSEELKKLWESSWFQKVKHTCSAL